jgi:enterochelin esterase-like enzyme
MKKLLFAPFFTFSITLFAQDYSVFTTTIKALESGDSAAIETTWAQLKADQKVPFIVQDSVAFLFKGKARQVSWMGDFNAWGYDKNFNVAGKMVGRDLWLLTCAFPQDARLDYKILLNGSDWILDPVNPYQQWSGVGGGSPNSELRMPKWKDEDVTSLPPAASGKITDDILFYSNALGYQIMYKVYTPAGYETMNNLPIMYVTDGYEYLHPKMGNMSTVLDNLIAHKKIKPIVAVFVDHREPVNRSNNRRMKEMSLNADYLKFFTDELVPHVEQNLKVSKIPTERGIMGTSLGGLNAAYFAFSRPDVFGLSGIQSPSFYTQPKIYQICDSPESPKIRVSMTSGIINDASSGTRKMKTILENNACVYFYKEVNEGHSWGNFRNLIDNILIDFFAIN